MKEYTYKEIIQYIADNYKFFHAVAKGITGQSYKADDLISTSILQLDKYKKTHNIKNINGYIYMILRNEFIGKNTEYAKSYNKTDFKYYDNDEINDFNLEAAVRDYKDLLQDDEYQTKQDEITSNKIIQYVQNHQDLTWYEKKIWLLYYQNEQFKKLEGLDKKEVDKIRKMSFRRLQKDLLINYETLCITVNNVNKKTDIKNKFKK